MAINDVSLLGKSKDTAEKDNIIWKKLSIDSNLKSLYSESMLEYKNLNHMDLVEESELGITYYMPHHGIYRPDKSSTHWEYWE